MSIAAAGATHSLSTRRNFEVGDVTFVAHGYNRYTKCGSDAATVTGATDTTFRMRCRCGAEFWVGQNDAYPNRTTGARWERWHEALFNQRTER